jgi:4-amino-4-deoxy-L-arabinose transferase-like glycosyltransferase
MQLGLMVAAIALSVAVATWLRVWYWRVDVQASSHEWRSELRLVLWFAWPAWPLALWTLWRWRWQIASRHVALPLWFVLVPVGTMVLTPTSDRSLLLALPALAALAAFALPTFSRSAAALIDWFTLLFFTICAIAIWVVWLSMQTGIPAKPAANIARLAPGFVPSFSLLALAAALAGTLAWAWLVRWRTGRHRQVIWKSLVLPASGTALCWLLLMTLGLPVLDYARSYSPLVRNVRKFVDTPGCVEELGLSRAQLVAFTYHGEMDLHPAAESESCPWLLVAAPLQPAAQTALDMRRWRLVANVRRPSDSDENVLVYRRVSRR